MGWLDVIVEWGRYRVYLKGISIKSKLVGNICRFRVYRINGSVVGINGGVRVIDYVGLIV